MQSQSLPTVLPSASPSAGHGSPGPESVLLGQRAYVTTRRTTPLHSPTKSPHHQGASSPNHGSCGSASRYCVLRVLALELSLSWSHEQKMRPRFSSSHSSSGSSLLSQSLRSLSNSRKSSPNDLRRSPNQKSLSGKFSQLGLGPVAAANLYRDGAFDRRASAQMEIQPSSSPSHAPIFIIEDYAD